MDEHGEDIEADLLSEYGVDLLHLGSGRLSWRRFGSLLERLPVGSRLVKARHGAKVEWSTTDHLLAAAVDLLAAANWQRGGDKNAARPKPIPRPGVGLSRDDIARRLVEQRNRLRR